MTERGRDVAEDDKSKKPSDDDTDLLRVRIGIEFWSAKIQPADRRQLPVGAEVKVTAVNGMVLDVEEHAVA